MTLLIGWFHPSTSWKHFGHKIIKTLYPNTAEKNVNYLYNKMYDSYIEAIDGVDNGVTQYVLNTSYDGTEHEIPPEALKKNYTSNTDISIRVSNFNPEWNQEYSVFLSDCAHEC